MNESLAPECAAVEPDLAELALGSLAGKPRAAALAHLDSCARCSAEVEDLSAAADELLLLAPRMEPSAGFEARVFEQLGLRHRPPRWRTWLTERPRLVLGVGALAVLAAFGTGTLVAGHPTTSGKPASPGAGSSYDASAPIETANFVSDGRAVGQVMVYAGNPTWLFMYVDNHAWQGELNCQVVLANGPTVTIGHFWPTQGKGAWGASVSQPAGRLRVAQITNAAGQVLATANLT